MGALDDRDRSYVERWVVPRPWGWVTMPAVSLGLPLGEPRVRLVMPRPDLEPSAVQAVGRLLAWRYGPVRVGVLLAVMLAGLGLLLPLIHGSSVPLSIAAAGAVGATAVGLDLLISNVLKRRAAAGLSATRIAATTVILGKRQRFGKDIPTHIVTPQVTDVIDLLDQLAALHEDHLVEDHEWLAARWRCWEVLEATPLTREAVGWAPLITNLEGLIQQAGRRTA